MPVKFLHVGGGPINDRDFRVGPWGEFHPQGIPNCCTGGLPEAALWYDPKYIGQFSPIRNEALACFIERNPIAVGDRLVLSIAHAGILLDDLMVENATGCTASQFHFEFHDLYPLVLEAQGGPVSTPDISLPVINGSVAGSRVFNLRDANGGVPYFGDRFGTVTTTEGDVPCRRHKALVLVFDALPTSATPVVAAGPCAPCQYGRVECSAGALSCVDITATVHVRVPGGVKHG